MVKITKDGDNFTFLIQGMHKLWAFKSSIEIPGKHINKAYKSDKDEIGIINGLRFPGTNLPGVLTAGTYFKSEGKVFCDVSNIENAITVELNHESYEKLVIEVENPEDAIALLSNSSIG